jgi:hypothetical protein
MKECFKCGKVKPYTEFYKHPQMADGHLNKCKVCNRKDAKEHREKNIERVREYDRKRGSLPHRVEAREEYSKTEKGKASLSKARKRYLDSNPDKRAAHVILGNAIRDGRIIKLPCECCSSTDRIHGHHEDYTKPIDVIWLCPRHHAALHKLKKGDVEYAEDLSKAVLEKINWTNPAL